MPGRVAGWASWAGWRVAGPEASRRHVRHVSRRTGPEASLRPVSDCAEGAEPGQT